MIRILITALIYLIGLFTQAQEPSQPELEQSIVPKSTMNTNVSDIKDGKGTVYVSFYVVEEDLVNKAYFQAKNLKEESNGVTMAFENAPFNVYNISSDYDKNDKGKREFDINGMPY